MLTRLEIHHDVIREIARSDRARSIVLAEAEAIVSRAGIPGYTDSQIGDERARAAAISRGQTAEETREALLRALPSGGG